jgi:hypothetical protein
LKNKGFSVPAYPTPSDLLRTKTCFAFQTLTTGIPKSGLSGSCSDKTDENQWEKQSNAPGVRLRETNSKAIKNDSPTTQGQNLSQSYLLCGRINCVVGTDHQNDVALIQLLVHIVHFFHNIVRHSGLYRQPRLKRTKFAQKGIKYQRKFKIESTFSSISHCERPAVRFVDQDRKQSAPTNLMPISYLQVGRSADQASGQQPGVSQIEHRFVPSLGVS